MFINNNEKTPNEVSLDWSDIQRIWLTPNKENKTIDLDLLIEENTSPDHSTPKHLEQVKCNLKDILADISAEYIPEENLSNVAICNSEQSLGVFENSYQNELDPFIWFTNAGTNEGLLSTPPNPPAKTAAALSAPAVTDAVVPAKTDFPVILTAVADISAVTNYPDKVLDTAAPVTAPTAVPVVPAVSEVLIAPVTSAVPATSSGETFATPVVPNAMETAFVPISAVASVTDAVPIAVSTAAMDIPAVVATPTATGIPAVYTAPAAPTATDITVTATASTAFTTAPAASVSDPPAVLNAVLPVSTTIPPGFTATTAPGFATTMNSIAPAVHDSVLVPGTDVSTAPTPPTVVNSFVTHGFSDSVIAASNDLYCWYKNQNFATTATDKIKPSISTLWQPFLPISDTSTNLAANMPQQETKALWQPFLPHPLLTSLHLPHDQAASLLIPPMSEVPLPPNEWLSKNENKKSPENIPLNEILKNIPQDRVNFSHQPSKQTNKYENNKSKIQTERKGTPQNKTSEKSRNDTENIQQNVSEMLKKTNLENRKMRPSYSNRKNKSIALGKKKAEGKT